MTSYSGDAALVLDGVSKRFGDHVAVDRVSLSCDRGKLYGFLGQNGAGKTTTIRMIMSILRPDEGSISILGHSSADQVRDRVGYLPEEKGLYKKMKAGEIIAYFGRLKGLDRTTARTRAKDLLGRYGLGDWHDTRCEALSKGMGQKVQILATLVHEPELIILDEPFSGLDPVNVELLRDLILDLKRGGRTIIFSTHVMEQAEQICDAIVLINKGKKILDGSIAKVRGGRRSIHLDYAGDSAALRQLPGVARVNDMGVRAEIFLDEGACPQKVLAALVGKVEIRRFDVSELSLHEVFVRAVKEAS